MTDPFDLLRAANPVPDGSAPPIEELWARLEQSTPSVSPVVQRTRSRRGRATAGSFVTVVCVILSIAVAVTAIALLSHGRNRQQSATAGADALIAKLAVLRRPQTPADILPTRYRSVQAIHHQGALIPGLTRLVATRPGARLYLVVTAPAGGPLPIWNPKLGDQVAIVDVVAGHAWETEPIPAADLTNADEVMSVGPRWPASESHDAFEVAVVPDGVARVRWTFANDHFKSGKVVSANAVSNIAITGFQRGSGLLLHGTWYAYNGRVIPTSDEARIRANAANNAVRRAAAVRYDELHSYRPAPALLADFAVFAITSRTGVRTASGDIISHPRLSSLPYPALSVGAPDQPPQLDPEDMRQVITPSGAELWIIPGKRGICLAALEKSPLPNGYGGGAAEGCNAHLTSAESEGVGFSAGSYGVATVTYQIVPKSIPTITIQTSRGVRKTIRVPDGVYVGPASQHR